MSMLKRTAKKKLRLIPKFHIHYKIVVVFMIAVIGVLAVTGGYLITAYENSVLDIYADQQDSYVQLVLDQINLQPERSDEEIVTNILSSLDTSNSKYWTLSKEQTLLFVKDVLETNRYKGFTTPTLYASNSAEQFVKGLALNRVKHEIIDMNEDTYVASGVLFRYNGSQYRICLLTNENIILDNNEFLSSRTEIIIYLIGLLSALLLVTMILSALLDIRNKTIQKLHTKIERLNVDVEQLEEEVELMDSFHTRWSLFNVNTMDTFVRKLEERKACPVIFTELSFEGEKGRELFLERAQLLLDKKVLRFSRGQDIILIFAGYYPEEAKSAMKQFEHRSLTIRKTMSCMEETESLWEVYQKFINGTEEERT